MTPAMLTITQASVKGMSAPPQKTIPFASQLAIPKTNPPKTKSMVSMAVLFSLRRST